MFLGLSAELQKLKVKSENMSAGSVAPPIVENVTHTIFHGFGAVGGGSGLDGSGHRPALGKHCIDLHQRLIAHGVHFVPGPDECTLCACDDGEPKWCKAVLCSPPQDCKSFRVGNSCCDFICLDDSLNNDGPRHGGPYLSRPVEIANFVPKVVIAAVTAMLSLSLLFFLIHRLRQRHIQGRLNSARARRSTQMCDECDDTRSLDFSNDFFEHRMNSPHLYPPQYLAWWKPPSSYFPPRGEAPPPYEEAMMATTSIGGNNVTSTTTTIAMPPYLHNNNNHHSNNHNQGGGTATTILNDIPIIVPPPVLPHGAIARSSPAAIQRLASAIANATSSGGSTTCTATITAVTTSSTPSPAPTSSSHNPSHNANRSSQESESRGNAGRESTTKTPALKNKSKSSKSKTSKTKDKHQTPPPPAPSSALEPQPGPSRMDTDSVIITCGPRPFRISPPQHGPPPPTYEDAIYSLHPNPRSAYYDHHRHSLTLPPRRFLDGGASISGGSHLYPQVVVHGSGETGPMTCYTEEELLRRAHHQNQRYSLQFHVGEGSGGGNGGGGDWSSSSSTLSLSTTPNSPVGRAPSLSSSSESSVSESNPPPPPAPSSSNNNNNTPRA